MDAAAAEELQRAVISLEFGTLSAVNGVHFVLNNAEIGAAPRVVAVDVLSLFLSASSLRRRCRAAWDVAGT